MRLSDALLRQNPQSGSHLFGFLSISFSCANTSTAFCLSLFRSLYSYTPLSVQSEVQIEFQRVIVQKGHTDNNLPPTCTRKNYVVCSRMFLPQTVFPETCANVGDTDGHSWTPQPQHCNLLALQRMLTSSTSIRSSPYNAGTRWVRGRF